MRARSARRLSVLPARTQLSSVERSSGVKVRAVGYLLMPHHDIERVSLQLSTSAEKSSVCAVGVQDVFGRSSSEHTRVELGEGIQGTCRIVAEGPAKAETKPESKADLSALSSMLQARWKGRAANATSKPEAVRAGQIRSFRIANLDQAAKRIELELVS